MFTDYHIHCLPGIDDGARSADDAVWMLDKLNEDLGYERFFATPHFIPHRERSVSEFLMKRDAASFLLKEKLGDKYIIGLGAEIALENGVSEIPDIEKLTYPDSNLLLLELPDGEFHPWIMQEIHNLVIGKHIVPVFAHIERYLKHYNATQTEEILSVSNSIYQFTLCAMNEIGSRRIFKYFFRNGLDILLGTDGHGKASAPYRVNDAKRGAEKIEKIIGIDNYGIISSGVL